MQNLASIAPASVRIAAGACVLLAGLSLPSGTAAQSTPASVVIPTRLPERDSTAPNSDEQDPQKADPKQKEETKKKPDDKVGFRWKGYPSLHLGKGTHVDLRARVQVDARGADSPGNDSDEP